MLDEKDTGASRIAFQEKKSEDQGSTSIGVSTSGVVVGDIDHGNDTTSERFPLSVTVADVHLDVSPPLEENVGDTSEGGGESSMRGMYRSGHNA